MTACSIRSALGRLCSPFTLAGTRVAPTSGSSALSVAQTCLRVPAFSASGRVPSGMVGSQEALLSTFPRSVPRLRSPHPAGAPCVPVSPCGAVLRVHCALSGFCLRLPGGLVTDAEHLLVTCWPFVYLWRKVYSSLLPILGSGVFLLLSFRSSLCSACYPLIRWIIRKYFLLSAVCRLSSPCVGSVSRTTF